MALYLALISMLISLPEFFFFNTKRNLSPRFEFKDKSLKQTSGKRIIIIGGSSALYGFNSPMIQESFPDYQVINAALTVNHGFLFYLKWIESRVKKGDIVIASPEYGFFYSEDSFYGSYFLSALTYSYDNYYKVLLKDINYSATFLVQTPNRFLFMIQKLWNPLDQSLIQRVMQKNHNAHGDYIITQPPKSYKAYSIDVHCPADVFLRYFDAFVKRLSEQSVTVFLTFQPIHKGAVTFHCDERVFLETLEQRLPSVSLLNRPRELMVPRQRVHDTPSHLDARGRDGRARRLIPALKAAFRKHGLASDPQHRANLTESNRGAPTRARSV